LQLCNSALVRVVFYGTDPGICTEIVNGVCAAFCSALVSVKSATSSVPQSFFLFYKMEAKHCALSNWFLFKFIKQKMLKAYIIKSKATVQDLEIR
jgi:hypothetical protein